MSNIAIRAENLGKMYRIGAKQERYRTMRDTLADLATSPMRHLRKHMPGADKANTTWAIKDVCFEIKQGEVLGIIGRNGAGKSTLLKILSRITEPTTGWTDIIGRMGSLLEVGTGFHPELTGRENIFLNGAILGMLRTDIRRRFDEIVAFAEVEKFIDTPVKRYSSGMYLRLAFAVAAHLETDILAVDEVLAVGDAAFQKKCLGKMGDVAQQGRTVLFVSHNMGIVQNLCQRGILLENGMVKVDDTASHAIKVYLTSLDAVASQTIAERTDRRGEGNVRFQAVEFSGGEDLLSKTLAVGDPARFVFHVTGVKPGLGCRFTVKDLYGQPVAHFNSLTPSPVDITDPALGSTFVCDIEEFVLAPGRYWVNIALFHGKTLEDHIDSAMAFDVEAAEFAGRSISSGTGYGVVCLRHRWTSMLPA